MIFWLNQESLIAELGAGLQAQLAPEEPVDADRCQDRTTGSKVALLDAKSVVEGYSIRNTHLLQSLPCLSFPLDFPTIGENYLAIPYRYPSKKW